MLEMLQILLLISYKLAHQQSQKIILNIYSLYFFHSILLLSDAKDVTNFTTYILQIGMSPITKNNSKHLFIILFK